MNDQYKEARRQHLKQKFREILEDLYGGASWMFWIVVIFVSLGIIGQLVIYAINNPRNLLGT